MKKFFLILMLLVLINSGLSAQSGIDIYLSPPFPTNLISSPDGKSIAWVFNEKGARNIYISDDKSNDSRRVTNFSGDEGLDLSDIRFLPDGEHIIFVRGNAVNNRGEPANPAFLQNSTERVIYITDTKNGNTRKISAGGTPRISPDGLTLAFISGGQIWTSLLTDTINKPQKLFQSRGIQSGLQWAPDSRRLIFMSNRGDHSFIGLYLFDKKTISFIETSIDFDISPVWSPDGKFLAFIRIPNIHNQLPFVAIRESNPWSIRLFNSETGKVGEIWKALPGKGSAFFGDLPEGEIKLWWGTNNQLIFPYEGNGWIHLYALDIESKKYRLLTPGNGEVENVTLSKDGQNVYYSTNIDDPDRRHIWQVNIFTATPIPVTKGNDIEWSPVVTQSGIAFMHSTATKPAWPAVLQNGMIKNISVNLFPSDFPSKLTEPKAVKITASDGIQFTGDLFLPLNYQQGKKYPAVIFLHGGSRRQMLLGFNYSQYYSNAYALNQYFASQGYVVLALNYRSGIGYGMEFREALHYGADGASEVNDLIAAGSYLQKRKDIDPKKIALWGGSYGGYLTAHGLGRAPQLFSAGVDIHGVHNWNDEIPTFAPWYDYAKFPLMAKKALESSPVFYIKNWKAPVLLVHGDDDRNVPFSESVNIAEILRKQGVHVEQLVLPDEVHSFLLYSNWIKTYESCFEFIDRQLKGK